MNQLLHQALKSAVLHSIVHKRAFRCPQGRSSHGPQATAAGTYALFCWDLSQAAPA